MYPPTEMRIRMLMPKDDVVALTGLLHRAYAPLAARGLRFVATHQSPEVTAQRFSEGYPLVVELEGCVVGTVTIYPPSSNASVAAYRDPHTYSFGQFAIEPAFKGCGIGRALHRAVLGYGSLQGAHFMSLDTAASATDLIAMYERWGYSIVDRVQWETTNYESVVMRRAIRNEPKRAAGAE